MKEHDTSWMGHTLGNLLVAFIVLRLCGVIEWNWIWVLAPAWIPLAALTALILIGQWLGIEVEEDDHGKD